jgi:ABC-type branched-subunit amino acid transport system ATPase component
MLTASNLSGGYNHAHVIKNLSLSVQSGTCLGIIGRNGVGKSTLGRLLQGSLKPTTGAISLDELKIHDLLPYQRRHLGISYMPQTDMVFDDLTVRENLLLSHNWGIQEDYFALFPILSTRLDQQAGTMSGGERKILAFVRTMMEDSNCIILDEPSEGVQPENIQHMVTFIKYKLSYARSVILIEQNINMLTQVADQYLGLDAGCVVLQSKAEEVTQEQLSNVLSI